MLPMRAIRPAFNALNVTRRRGATIASIQTPIRLNSSSAAAPVEQKVIDEAVDSNVSQLELYFGQKNAAKARRLSRDVGQLNEELKRIYRRQRVLKRTIKGPFRVRTSAVSQGGITDTSIHIEDNKLIIAGKVVPNIWLRDNCQCSSCMHGATKQRLLDTFSIPQDIAIKSHAFEDENSILNIEWSDGHSSTYPRTLLSQTAKSEGTKAILRQGLSGTELWDATTIASAPPKTTHHFVRKQSLSPLLRNLRRYGFCYVDEVPFEDPLATKELLESIAFIRETHYGGFYDFTADLASKDTAYTNIALEAHTDTTYFSDPAGLQAFHLLSHTEGEGGASLLVDGFKVAEELSVVDRRAYEVLSTVNVHAHASGNEGISIQPYRGFPVLEHDPMTGDLLRVRWNSADRAGIELPVDEMERWYDAARKFDGLLKKKENEYWEQLTPGRVLIFDNWRVLHGRSSFTGKRRICGGYINRDDWISKYKMAEFGQEKVLEGLAVN
ncbi:Trimethyllysine dioxygenase [Clathrospora elynae]|uniref:Trimethyllysine dioxygenase n=1 Tax=Clathrospora elynae TaxID=706981 RepID=A0A6A5T7R0_9PLEO|nr:Trimethyllysine dioxygenase [Clathrospora elynae]